MKSEDLKKYKMILPRVSHVCEICNKRIKVKEKCGFRSGEVHWRYYGREYVHLEHLKDYQITNLKIDNDVKTFFQF